MAPFDAEVRDIILKILFHILQLKNGWEKKLLYMQESHWVLAYLLLAHSAGILGQLQKVTS